MGAILFDASGKVKQFGGSLAWKTGAIGGALLQTFLQIGETQPFGGFVRRGGSGLQANLPAGKPFR